jgi:3-hydroxyacyl-[acyl-carrier-protein] dehydratase
MDPVTENNSVLQVSVRLNVHHPIFKGHFPGQPVLPGVCMLEMIQEIMEEYMKQKLRISKGPLIKFLAMIVPDRNPFLVVEAHYDKRDGNIFVSGKIFHEATVFMKYNLEFIPEPA